MARNILLTSLSAAEHDLPLRYFGMEKEFGFDYCSALLDAEAGIKAVLARHSIDEVIVIGAADAYDERDERNAVRLGDESSLYSEDRMSFSAYRLLRYRLAQYADELNLDEEAEEKLLPEEMREKLTRFAREYQEKSPELKETKFNRLFDAISQSGQAYEDFRNAFAAAFPELRDYEGSCIRWIKNYLYGEMKSSAKLEPAPVNTDTIIRFVPEESVEEGGQWVDSMMAMEKSIVEDREDINLYVSLNSDDAADTFIVINLLELLVSMQESRIRLQKIYTVRSLQRRMAGMIRDDTEGFGVTEVFHALHSFLNYGKADRVVKIWEKSGERNESIAAMVYAMRRVDVGLSMCNIPEVEGGILRLRRLFRDEAFWRETGRYGMGFSVLAESIREDYGVLLEGDGDIPFIEMVKWAYRHQFYQQTLTLIESRAPENLVKSGIFYYCGDEKKKDQVIQLLVKQRQMLKPYEYYKMDEIDHYFIKTYNRAGTRGMGGRDDDPQRVYASLRAKSLENTDPSMITGLSACSSAEMLEDILFAYYHIGQVRNKISHADAEAMAGVRLMVSESDEISALVWMKDSIDYFIDRYEKAMADVQTKKPQVVRITADEVRTAAEHARRDR